MENQTVKSSRIVTCEPTTFTVSLANEVMSSLNNGIKLARGKQNKVYPSIHRHHDGILTENDVFKVSETYGSRIHSKIDHILIGVSYDEASYGRIKTTLQFLMGNFDQNDYIRIAPLLAAYGEWKDNVLVGMLKHHSTSEDDETIREFVVAEPAIISAAPTNLMVCSANHSPLVWGAAGSVYNVVRDGTAFELEDGSLLHVLRRKAIVRQRCEVGPFSSEDVLYMYGSAMSALGANGLFDFANSEAAELKPGEIAFMHHDATGSTNNHFLIYNKFDRVQYPWGLIIPTYLGEFVFKAARFVAWMVSSRRYMNEIPTLHPAHRVHKALLEIEDERIRTESLCLFWEVVRFLVNPDVHNEFGRGLSPKFQTFDEIYKKYTKTDRLYPAIVYQFYLRSTIPTFKLSWWETRLAMVALGQEVQIPSQVTCDFALHGVSVPIKGKVNKQFNHSEFFKQMFPLPKDFRDNYTERASDRKYDPPTYPLHAWPEFDDEQNLPVNEVYKSKTPSAPKIKRAGFAPLVLKKVELKPTVLVPSAFPPLAATKPPTDWSESDDNDTEDKLFIADLKKRASEGLNRLLNDEMAVEDVTNPIDILNRSKQTVNRFAMMEGFNQGLKVNENQNKKQNKNEKTNEEVTESDGLTPFQKAAVASVYQ